MQPGRQSRLRKLFDDLRASYWFLPALFVLAAVMLAFVMHTVDSVWNIETVDELAFLNVGDQEAARSILTSLTSSMITIATLTFSMTIVALTLAMSHYGSRLLYNFMRDRGNQITLGTFLATFTYCLLTLRSVHPGEEQGFVPHLATSFAILLALISIGVLIYFIHHVAESIQANVVIAAVSSELAERVDRFYPDHGREHDHPEESSLRCPGEWMPVIGRKKGVLQVVNLEALAKAAAACDAGLRLKVKAGDFLIPGMPIAEACGTRWQELAGSDAVQQAFLVGRRRTLIQDVEFAFLQLVEIGVRALSPGINDPFTAMACADELGAGLSHIMRRGRLPTLVRDSQGVHRVERIPPSFEDIVDAAFEQLGQYAEAQPDVLSHILGVLNTLLLQANTRDQHQALQAQAQRFERLLAAARHDRFKGAAEAPRDSSTSGQG